MGGIFFPHVLELISFKNMHGYTGELNETQTSNKASVNMTILEILASALEKARHTHMPSGWSPVGQIGLTFLCLS